MPRAEFGKASLSRGRAKPLALAALVDHKTGKDGTPLALEAGGGKRRKDSLRHSLKHGRLGEHRSKVAP